VLLTKFNKKRRLKGSKEVKVMIKPIIEFCISNLANGSQKAREILERDPNLDIIEYGCLGHCGICAVTLFALVNGERVREVHRKN
jgi:uncharacterized protein YuzB (UPF0349 family)